MTADKPLIGITVYSRRLPSSDSKALGLRPTYTHAVTTAGGAPILIPLEADRDVQRTIFERLDGIILSGGGDLSPESYHADEVSPYTALVDPVRDSIEFQLVRWANDDDKPLLAICRGHQVLNVALGGTLIQDLRTTLGGTLRHDAPNDSWFYRISHEVTVEPGSALQAALGITDERLAVNSLHHQGIDQLAPDLIPVAHAEDGVIEGITLPGRRFILGVQWHPEALVDDHPPMKNLFVSLVNAARS